MTRPRLLLVDDDRAITSTLAPLLRDMADCDAAHSVAEALAALAAHTYRGCVLDLVLGDDASPLHDALASREVPVLLVSGRDPASLERVATPRGWSFAAKPVAAQVLRDLVGDLLGVEVPSPSQRGVRVQASTPAPATRGAPVAVQVIDRLGDIVGVIALAALCYAGKLSGELALVGIGAILGVSTGLRSIGGRSVGAATAAVALAALLSTTPAEATDRPPPPPAAPLALLTVALALVGALIAVVTT